MPAQLLNQVNGQMNSQLNDLQQQLIIETVSNNGNSNNGLSQSQTTPNTNLTSSTNAPSSIDIKQSAEQHYLIGVADRSNNRIQLMDYNAKTQQTNVINVFGSGPGTRAGQFDRPAGICINLGE